CITLCFGAMQFRKIKRRSRRQSNCASITSLAGSPAFSLLQWNSAQTESSPTITLSPLLIGLEFQLSFSIGVLNRILSAANTTWLESIIGAQAILLRST